MSLTALKASLALWERREKKRKQLHTVAQQDLMEARARGASGKELQALVDRRDLRSRQLTEARNLIKRRIEQIEAKQRKKVRRPHERIKRNVRNRSSRNGAPERLIVLHSTESHNRAGLSDILSIWNWFDNPGSQASSHVIVDDEGMSARCVPDGEKAWTQASYNPQSLSVEMIGFAAQGKAAWTDAQVRKVAQYIAYWSTKHGIPIRVSTVHGVCTHKMLGAAGGGHVDPGPAFPLERCLKLAQSYKENGW